MLDFQAIRMLHRHSDGDYTPMTERTENSAAAADPERQWKSGTRIFACDVCSDEIVVEPAVDMTGEAPNPTV